MRGQPSLPIHRTQGSSNVLTASPSRLILIAAAFASMLALLAGCSSPPANRGASGGRMDPASDSPSEYGTLDLRSQDLVTATDRMARDIAQRLDISNRDNPPRIFVGEIENQTTRPERDYQVFANRLRAQLLSSETSTRSGLDFRRERAFVEQQRNREFGGKDPDKTAAAYRSEAEYVLTCIVQDMPTRGTNYYLLEYQLVQLVDKAVSGPDVGPGAIVWSGFYEVKFN